jgi:hypothetical protein
MKLMKSIAWFLIPAACCTVAITHAADPSSPTRQTELGQAPGQFIGPGARTNSARRLAAPHVSARRVRLPETKSGPETSADPACDACGYAADGGDIKAAARNFLEDASWKKLEDGSQVLKIELESKNTGGLRVKFSGELPPGVVLRTYDSAGNVAEPFDPESRYREEIAPQGAVEKTWWGPTVWGEVAGLEFWLPAGQPLPQRFPQIVKIAYYYRLQGGLGTDGTSGTELTCHLDVTCFPEWANEAIAVARLQWPAEEAGKVRFCSGALLNRSPSDGAPIFMTAAHCIHRQVDATAVEVLWLFQRSNCNGALPSMGSLPTSHGALILKLHINADWSLLGLFDPPPVNFYLGWDNGNTQSWSNNAPATAISHPEGTHKRIALGLKGGDSSRPFDLPTGIFPIINVWDINFVGTNGVVEPGSSGCPILDDRHKVRGALTGTYSFTGCPPITYHWGRLEYAWSTVKYYLENMANPTCVDGTVSGDNNNEGSSEQGTSSNPFNTVREATYCVRSGEILRIAAGNYNERFKFWRPMTLQASGGPARIGAP